MLHYNPVKHRDVWYPAQHEPMATRRPRTAKTAGTENIDRGVLAQLLGYAIRRAQIAVYEDFFRAVGSADITPPRFTALALIEANPGLSQTALGQTMGIARSGAMMLMDWLERNGLATRQAHSEDRRRYGLYLTAKGRTALASLKTKVLASDRRIAAGLDPAETRELRRLLDKLTAAQSARD